MSNKNGKFFDIIPPSAPTNTREEVRQMVAEDKHCRKGWKLVLALGLIASLSVAAYVFLVKIKVEVWPEIRTVSLEEKIVFDTGVKTVDMASKRIPATVFEVSQELSKDFVPTGKSTKSEKARGKIRVYNSYSEESQSLVTSTRFLSADGKLFRAASAMIIPGGTEEKGKLTPGYVDVDVVAAEAGEGYNIDATTFSIPGFVGSPKYTAFYGKSFSPMTGGYKGEVLQVTVADLEKAKNTVTNELFEKGNAALQEKALQEFMFVGGALKSEVKDGNASNKEGDLVPTFSYRARMTMKALVFKKADSESLCQQLVISNSELAEENLWSLKEARIDNLTITQKLEAVDFDRETATINATVSAAVYYPVNEPLLKRNLNGKTINGAAIFLKSQPQIRKADIKAWPFWIDNIPIQEDKVEIKMNLGGN